MTEQPGEDPYEYEDTTSAALMPYYGAYLVPEDDDYDPEWDRFREESEYEAEYYRSKVPLFNTRFDLDSRKWVCDCARFVMYGACLHSYKYRGETVVKVSKDYL